MQSTAVPTTLPFAPRAADVLAVGFGTAVCIWVVAYLLRLPAVHAPAWALTAWLAAALLGGGYVIGRFSRRGFIGGMWVGLTAGLLNLLILGSALAGTPELPASAMPVFALVSLAASAFLGILGAAFGNTRRARLKDVPNWLGMQSRVQVVAVFVLLFAGGLVTSNRAGLAVPDWPDSFGFNMFLLPLARMDEPGVFLEHSHRLLGALVGLTALATALLLSFTRLSKQKLLAWCIFVAVAVQGVLGGLRVTEISAVFGAVHGVLGQMIFGAVVALAVLLSERWLGDVKPVSSESGGVDRQLTIGLIALLLVQVGLGAHMRHTHEYQMLILHITVAVLILALAVFLGVRALATYRDVLLIRRSATGLMHVIGVQLVLGIVALASGAVRAEDPSFLQALAATLHQANGALILAFAVRLALWNHRLLRTTDVA